MKTPSVYLLLALSLFVFSGLRAESAKPNILLIITDDLGCQLGCYGDDTVPTPHIDSLAQEGVMFTNGYVTAASCSPSRGSIFTGLYPHQHGMYGLSHQDWATRFGHRIKDGTALLPNKLKELGYRTAIYGKRHYQPEEAFAWDDEVENMRHLLQRDVVLMANSVDRFIGGQHEEPFFVVASYADPHRFGNVFTPYQKLGLPENPFASGEVEPLANIGLRSEGILEDAAGYFNMVKRLDHGIGLLLQTLEKNDALDNTLILFVSDNGPDFIRLKKSVYEDGVRVPYIVRWPGQITPGLVRDEFVSTVDIFSTLLSAASGCEQRHGAGRPLQPLFSPGKVTWRDAMMSEFIVHAPVQYYPSYALHIEGYQLIHNLASWRKNPVALESKFPEWTAANDPENRGNPFTESYLRYASPPEYELYNVKEDPFQLENLAAEPEYAQLLARMQARLLHIREMTADPFLDASHMEEMNARYKGVTPFVEAE